jgi:hypothetical protein
MSRKWVSDYRIVSALLATVSDNDDLEEVVHTLRRRHV